MSKLELKRFSENKNFSGEGLRNFNSEEEFLEYVGMSGRKFRRV